VLKIQKNIDISKFSTLRVKAEAALYAAPENFEDVPDLFRYIKAEGLSWEILGAGSNALLSSRGIEGVLIHTRALDFVELGEDGLVEVGAGILMPRFCAKMAQESLTGMEFMEGIPGTVGGGVVMNAGAHGSEMAKIFKSAKALNLETLEVETFSYEDIQFKYRRSIVDPTKYFLISASFVLKQGNKEEIREKIKANNTARSTHQPIKAWTCGCTFKNPDSNSAGKLIDEIGAKGLREGDFVVSEKHGNFFENLGEGTSMDFCNLMRRVQKLAYEKKGIILEPEVKRIGLFSEEEDLLWQPQKLLLT